jgi:hypothetical protein
LSRLHLRHMNEGSISIGRNQESDMSIPKQSAPICRAFTATQSDDRGERTDPPVGHVEAGEPGVVASSLVDAFMYAIRGPAKGGCEGPILVTPSS